MPDLFIKRLNAVHAQIECDRGIAQELHEAFTYKAPGYQWTPAYKYQGWSGDIREFNLRNQTIRVGLSNRVRDWANRNQYTIGDDGKRSGDSSFTEKEALDFIATLNLPFAPHEHQVAAFVHAIQEGRGVLLSPTSSGKSLIIYLLFRYYETKTLIVVPTIALVEQMASDFRDYGCPFDIHKITAGKSKHSEALCTISTWQSIFKEDRDYHSQWQLIIGDECHLYAAKSMSGVLDKAINAHLRFGTTGTLSEAKANEICLTGLFGPVHKVTTTAELMEKGLVSQLAIKCIVLEYSEATRRMAKAFRFQDEIKFLIGNDARNNFIKKLAINLTGNTLILFRFRDHGRHLHRIISESVEEGRNVYFVDGGVEAEEREYIRKIIETEENAIIVASRGTMSTGSNTKRLHNTIFAHPMKSKISNLQSLGRGLRLAEGKTGFTLYDIADDLHWKSHKNDTLKHFISRVKVYAEEQLKYKLFRVPLKE